MPSYELLRNKLGCIGGDESCIQIYVFQPKLLSDCLCQSFFVYQALVEQYLAKPFIIALRSLNCFEKGLLLYQPSFVEYFAQMFALLRHILLRILPNSVIVIIPSTTQLVNHPILSAACLEQFAPLEGV